MTKVTTVQKPSRLNSTMIAGFVNRHKKLIVFLASCCAISCLCLYWPAELEYSRDSSDLVFKKFIVDNDKCKMPELDPWSPDALQRYHKMEKEYQDEPLLVKMERDEGVVYLVVDEAQAKKKRVESCSSCVVLPGLQPVPDNSYEVVDCKTFTNKTVMRNSVMYIECFSQLNQELVYRDVVANYVGYNFTTTEASSAYPFNVIIVGYDSMSRQNLQRTMPETSAYLHNTNWTEFQGYNKIGENTLPNLMGILTGMLSNTTDYGNQKFFDNKYFLWKEYQNRGYVTVFFEDDLEINTFNTRRNGFNETPTDFYFRPYTQIMESLPISRLFSRPFKTGGRLTAQRVFDLASELPLASGNKPFFGFFWLNSFSHDNLNAPQLMDIRTVAFFKRLIRSISNNTFVMFVSDHGFRFGSLRKTITGWYEDHMPFLYIWAPQSFKSRHPKKYEAFESNNKKLTSSYDLHITLQHILAISNASYEMHSAPGCPKCVSLFEDIPNIRSCSDAGIAEMYCSCAPYSSFDKKHKYVRDAGKLIVEEAQEILDSNRVTRDKCWKLKLAKILSAQVSQVENSTSRTLLLLVIETNPVTVLEGMIRIDHSSKVANYKLIGKVLRIDRYQDTSECITNSSLKTFCHCSPYGYLLSYIGL